jgi:hypothetical protein
MKRVIFYNHFNNGDIHVSREFVRGIMSKITTPTQQFFYSHKHDPKLIVDIPDVSADRSFLPLVGVVPKTSMIGDMLFINTWYAAENHRYMNRFGISFDCLYFLFDDICKEKFNFSLSDVSADPRVFFPSINYVEYHIKLASAWMQAHPGRKVFISNGPVLSGQADNFNMTGIIKILASRHPDIIFIVTNRDDNLPETGNIFYSSSIIQKIGSDLNENGYLSTFCDLIIGRASGPFTFAFTRENIFNRHATILCFSNLESKGPNKFWLGDHFRDKIEYTAKIVVSGETQEVRVLDIIEGNL